MPLYEYRCINCGIIMEDWSKIEDRNKPRDCPRCGSVCSRVQSAPSFILEGSGWASDGYSPSSKKDKDCNNKTG